jgi:paxillin
MDLLMQKFAHRCHHCKTPIVDSRFVTLDDNILGQRYYHDLHFFCSECGDPFLDPSHSPDAEETNAFVIHKGHPYCERCHLRLHKPKCKACAQPIPDVAINAMGAKWHKECFVCSVSAITLH